MKNVFITTVCTADVTEIWHFIVPDDFAVDTEAGVELIDALDDEFGTYNVVNDEVENERDRDVIEIQIEDRPEGD